jgi:hypothetical protein
MEVWARTLKRISVGALALGLLAFLASIRANDDLETFGLAVALTTLALTGSALATVLSAWSWSRRRHSRGPLWVWRSLW